MRPGTMRARGCACPGPRRRGGEELGPALCVGQCFALPVDVAETAAQAGERASQLGLALGQVERRFSQVGCHFRGKAGDRGGQPVRSEQADPQVLRGIADSGGVRGQLEMRRSKTIDMTRAVKPHNGIESQI